MNYSRLLNLYPETEKRSILLLGPRQTGKSTLLRQAFPEARYYNLLYSDVFFRMQADPSILRQELAAASDNDSLVIIDEIQKLPVLLDEIQVLIDEKGRRFIMTGSSARKLKSGGANLLGGRARVRYLFPFVSAEIPDFDLSRALSWGCLPPVYLSDEPEEDLRAYCGTYLREEIQAEALVRKLEGFSRFLAVAGLSNGLEINYEKLAGVCSVPARTVREYTSLLVDTLVACTLDPWQRGGKRKAVSRSKLYFFDLGVARVLAGKPVPSPNTAEWGSALEQFVFQELRAWLSYNRDDRSLTYWRTVDGREVDFVLGDDYAVEVKAANRLTAADFRGLREIAKEKSWKGRVLVCREPSERLTDDGVLVVPIEVFLARLWSGGFK